VDAFDAIWCAKFLIAQKNWLGVSWSPKVPALGLATNSSPWSLVHNITKQLDDGFSLKKEVKIGKL
jgi:hypothetical protein